MALLKAFKGLIKRISEFFRIFRGCFFLVFPLWSLESVILVLKFGFYVKFPPWSRTDTSGNLQDFTLCKISFSKKFRGGKNSDFSSYSFEIHSSDSRNSFSRSSSIGSDPGIMEIRWFLNPVYDHSRFTLFDRKFVREIDRKLSETQIKTFQNTSLKLPPNTRKLLINHPELGVASKDFSQGT